MNFFKHQDDARKKSGRLVLLLALAVFVLIVITTLMLGLFLYFLEGNSTSVTAHHSQQRSLIEHLLRLVQTELILWIAASVITVVTLGSLYKSSQLKRGGDYVAQALGGRLVLTEQTDAKQKQLLNVVEEMAIASGMAVPRVYLMPDAGINAFAAGSNTSNAIIGITQGCLDALNRDQLQGVIAHEFSHIHHGDMRLNMRLIAVLHGILLIGLIGEVLLRSSASSSLHQRSRKKGNGGAILGLGLMAVGFSGVFFGNMIKAAVSRQREFLADASAVQYTRNPNGIAAALLKIKRNVHGSKLENEHASEFSHFFFANGVTSFFSNIFATHPPLDERISRVYPDSLAELQQTVIEEEHRGHQSQLDENEAENSNPAFGYTSSSSGISDSGEQAAAVSKASLDTLISHIGDIHPFAIDFSTALLAALPTTLHQAAHSAYQARAIAYALLIDAPGEIQDKQLAMLAKRAHPATFKELEKIMAHIVSLDETLKFPLLQLAQPALMTLSEPQKKVFITNLYALIKADERFSIREWAVLTYLLNGYDNEASTTTKKIDDLREEIKSLLGFASLMNDARHRQASLDAAIQQIWPEEQAKLPERPSLKAVSKDLEQLKRLRPIQKPIVLKALSHCMTFDGHVSITEQEVLRTVSAVLDAPMPMWVQQQG